MTQPYPKRYTMPAALAGTNIFTLWSMRLVKFFLSAQSLKILVWGVSSTPNHSNQWIHWTQRFGHQQLPWAICNLIFILTQRLKRFIFRSPSLSNDALSPFCATVKISSSVVLQWRLSLLLAPETINQASEQKLNQLANKPTKLCLRKVSNAYVWGLWPRPGAWSPFCHLCLPSWTGHWDGSWEVGPLFPSPHALRFFPLSWKGAQPAIARKIAFNIWPSNLSEQN